MCRLLAVVSRDPIDVKHHLDAFTEVCITSPEYQGHGWGCAVLRGNSWEQYRSVDPIWSDRFRPSGQIHLLLAHARSAFRNEDIVVDNNMPFMNDDQAFIFNGELHGVRLSVEGRTGAHRLFRFLRNGHLPDKREAVRRGMRILRSRTAHIRACNFILADPGRIIVHSLFNDDPDYFTMYQRRTPDDLVVCSSRYLDQTAGWTALPNDSLEEFSCSF
jgi:predicted glutamine amidotransferase